MSYRCSSEMVFIILQIQSGTKVLKQWYGCVINESCTLSDVYTEFSNGRIDGSYHYQIGQYVEYNVSTLPVRDSMCTETDTRVDAMAILMRGALQRSHLPDKWKMDSPNKKLKLKNDIIDWLQTNKLGWEPLYAQQLGVAFVNTLANTLWMIDGNHQTLADRSCQIDHFQGYNRPELRKKKTQDQPHQVEWK